MRYHSNDYSNIEKTFLAKTGLEITSGYSPKIRLCKSVSIIIPVFNDSRRLRRTLIAIEKQFVPGYFKKKIELIIVDDGSQDSRRLIRSADEEIKSFKFIIARLKNNAGCSVARNLGLLLARGEIIIFADADTVPDRYWLVNHVLRQQLCKNVATLGMDHPITIGDPRITLKNLRTNLAHLRPTHRKDFRYEKYVPLAWQKTVSGISRKNFGRTYRLIEDTDSFKKFFYPKLLGVWRLPFMFLSGNVAVRRNEIIKAGGFDMDFKGWGMEDTYLGYKLMINGIYMIPLFSSSAFHIRNDNANQKIRLSELRKNIAVYNRKLNSGFKKSSPKDWEREMHNGFRGRYEIVKIISRGRK